MGSISHLDEWSETRGSDSGYLIKRCLNGDPSAWNEFLRRYTPPIESWIKKTLISRNHSALAADPDVLRSMPIRLTQVETLGYDPVHVRLPSDSFGVSASLP